MKSGFSGDPSEQVVAPRHSLDSKQPKPARDEQQTQEGAAASNVADRRRAQEAQALLAAIVSASDDAIISKSLDGRILTWNAGAERLFGYAAEEAIGQSIELIIPPELRSEEESIAAQLRQGLRVDHYETVRMAKDGRRLDISLSVSPVRDAAGRIVGASKVARDITDHKRWVAALRESEDRYRAVVESQAEMICRFRPDGSLVFVNAAYARARGTTPENLLGTNFWNFVPEDERAAVRADLDRLTPDSPEMRIENRFETSAGPRWTLWTNRALAFDPEGRWTEAQSAGIDITDRKRAEETIRTLLRISERLNSTLQVDALLDILVQEAIALVGATGGVSGLNSPEGMRCTKYIQQGAAVPLEYCWPPLHGLPGWVAVHKQPYLTNDAARDTQIVQALCKQFGVTSALSTPILTAQGEVLGFFEIHNKQSEGGFTEADRQLLLSVSQSAAIAVQNALAYHRIQEAEESLRAADRRKNDFIAILAHELRNPLAPIRNAVEMLRYGEQDATVLQQARTLMERQLAQMVRLIDDLLDVGRITSGKLELRRERISLAAVVEQAVEASRPFIAEAGHQLTLTLPSEPIYLDADPVRLAQVFANLLHNAAKYTEPGGTLWLAAHCQDGEVRVTVRDTGIGIAPENLSRLFQIFSQVESALDRSQGGLGIGLSLVKGLVEMHGGSVSAASEGANRGSAFTVRLPILVEEVNVPTKAPQEPSPDPQGACRVLVVDDNRDSAMSMAMLLRLKGNQVETAFDGLEAIETAERFRPNLVLLDIGMPRLNGYDACRRIREEDWGRQMRIVALTGWGQEEDRRRTTEAGFDDHLVKPVDAQALLNLLEQAQMRS